ncbi:MAG: hypothetical protein H7Z13_06995 [Ferruginibacter sp.]|nr:hypothetical protein [Ferruginibacter sp.]
MRKKRIVVLYYMSAILLVACDNNSAKPDNDYDNSVSDPKLREIQTKVLFDESHKNHHKIANTYKPFAILLSNDGCLVKANDKPISKKILSETNIYVIATAMGKVDPGDISPFTQQEINELENWVDDGGAVLVITEHFPFGLAMAPLLKKFGIAVHNGYTEDTSLNNKNVMDALLFEKSHGNLNSNHRILDKVERINTFTGSSVKGDSTWTPLLIFSPNAQNYNVKVDVKKNGGDITTSVGYADFYSAKGYSQGLCRQYGKGRIVVLAESAFLTAQIDKNGNKFGMNIPESDNKQFALNVIRWLAKQ